MKSKLGAFFGFLLFLSVSHAQENRGGGGIVRDGQVMTFYSAGLITASKTESVSDVPSLNQLMQTLYKLPYFTRDKMVRLITAIRPSSTRTYYRVLEQYFDDATEKRLKAEYVRALHLSGDVVTLFAVTETTSKTTYLLPNFYKLSPIEQMALLFHESYWVSFPDSTHGGVVGIEAKLQAFLEKPQDGNRVMGLVRALGGTMDSMKAAAQLDRQSGALNSLLNKDGKISAKDLFGPEAFSCMRTDGYGYDCRTEFKYHLIDLGMKYPNSFLITAMQEQFDKSDKNMALLGKDDLNETWGRRWSSLLTQESSRECTQYRTVKIKNRYKGDGGYFDYYDDEKQVAYNACLDKKTLIGNAAFSLDFDEESGAFVGTSGTTKFYLAVESN